MKNAFTVDLEDWYQGIGIGEEHWHQYEKRLLNGTKKLLLLLKSHNTKATFFTLGKVIEEYPALMKEIVADGHEIACHTYSHPFLYEINAKVLDDELKKCNELLWNLLGIKQEGFRAPYFSLDKRSWWALDVLKNNGFTYDSSVYPGDNKRTGIVGYNKKPHRLENGMIEFPLTTIRVGRFDVGLGGAYFRILPYFYFRSKLKALNRAGQAGAFYIHPWELDPGHPYLPQLSKRIKYPHYFNLKTTEQKIDKLLSDFTFVPLRHLINEFKINEGNGK